MRKRMTGNCIECNSSDVHAKDKCYKCYRKTYKQPTITCKNCHRERQHAAFGLCKSCHIKLHHYDKVKTYNARKYHRLSLELYKKLVNRACIFCEFDKVLELHHLDGVILKLCQIHKKYKLYLLVFYKVLKTIYDTSLHYMSLLYHNGVI